MFSFRLMILSGQQNGRVTELFLLLQLLRSSGSISKGLLFFCVFTVAILPYCLLLSSDDCQKEKLSATKRSFLIHFTYTFGSELKKCYSLGNKGSIYFHQLEECSLLTNKIFLDIVINWELNNKFRRHFINITIVSRYFYKMVFF